MAENSKLSWNEVNYWLEEARSCEDKQQQMLVSRNNYPLLVKFYEGFQSQSTVKKSVIINEYFPNINALISEIMYQNPDFVVNATKPDAEENAPINSGTNTWVQSSFDTSAGTFTFSTPDRQAAWGWGGDGIDGNGNGGGGASGIVILWMNPQQYEDINQDIPTSGIISFADFYGGENT